MNWGSIIWTFIKALFGISTKPDPVADARKETEAKVKAQDRVTQLEAALKGQEAARATEAKANEAALKYQEENHQAEKPVPVPKTEAELQAVLDAANAAHKKREMP